MQIEDMTVEQIEQYLQERKTRKPKLGGTVKQVSEMEQGETGWIQVVCERVFEDGSGACFYPFGDPKIDFAVRPNHIVETNVPERAPARRRMTVAEAAEQLRVGQEVWIKCLIDKFDANDPDQPMRVDTGAGTWWPEAEVEIAVDA